MSDAENYITVDTTYHQWYICGLSTIFGYESDHIKFSDKHVSFFKYMKSNHKSLNLVNTVPQSNTRFPIQDKVSSITHVVMLLLKNL